MNFAYCEAVSPLFDGTHFSPGSAVQHLEELGGLGINMLGEGGSSLHVEQPQNDLAVPY